MVGEERLPTGASPLSEDEALAIIAAGLRRRRRQLDLVTIAQSIRYLTKLYDSKRSVAERAQVSVNMLDKFLAIWKLTPEVRELSRNRDIDRVMDVFWLSKVRDEEKQRELAEVIAGDGLKTQEVRDIVRILRDSPGAEVSEIVDRVKDSRPETQRVYAVVMPLRGFQLQTEEDEQKVLGTVSHHLPNEGIKLEGNALVVFFTSWQYRRARTLARREGVEVTQLASTLLTG